MSLFRSALLLFKSDYVAKHSADSNAKEASGQAWKDLPPATKATWNEKWRAVSNNCTVNNFFVMSWRAVSGICAVSVSDELPG